MVPLLFCVQARALVSVIGPARHGTEYDISALSYPTVPEWPRKEVVKWRYADTAQTTRRPIIFIGHCLGGLIVKTVGINLFGF